jgi:transcriptional regulator with XRE-family HTH domain
MFTSGIIHWLIDHTAEYESMSMRKTVVQQALLDLRKRLEMTQQDLAIAMSKTVVTICRWETVRPPSGYSLLELAQYARDRRAIELAEVLERALRQEGGPAANQLNAPAGELRVYWTNEQAIEEALLGLRANSAIPSVRREYLKLLRATIASHAVLLREARAGAETNNPWKYYEDLQNDLELLLKYEQDKQKTKTKR